MDKTVSLNFDNIVWDIGVHNQCDGAALLIGVTNKLIIIIMYALRNP